VWCCGTSARTVLIFALSAIVGSLAYAARLHQEVQHSQAGQTLPHNINTRPFIPSGSEKTLDTHIPIDMEQLLDLPGRSAQKIEIRAPLIVADAASRRVRLQNAGDGQETVNFVSFTSESDKASPFPLDPIEDDPSCIPYNDQPGQVSSPNIFATPGQDPILSRAASPCRVLSYFNGIDQARLCSGNLIDSFNLLTARHCTYDPCLGKAVRVRVACRYGSYVGATDYARMGSAFLNLTGDCVFSDTYDATARCENGVSVRGKVASDIQICPLDRAVGVTVQKTTPLETFERTSKSYLQSWSYPGDSKDNASLNAVYNSPVTDLPFYRVHYLKDLQTNAVSYDSYLPDNDTKITLSNSWMFAGEDGGAFLGLGNDNLNRAVGVFVGGVPGSGCKQFGAKVTDQLINKVESRNAPPPPPHCQLVEYPGDWEYLTGYSSPPPRVKGLSFDSELGPSKLFIFEENKGFFPYIGLSSVGSLPAFTNIRWYASENAIITTADEYLGENIPLTFPINVRGIIFSNRGKTSDPGLMARWNGIRYIGAIWETNLADGTASCKTDDGNWAVVGTVETGCKCVDPLSLNNGITCFNETLSCASDQECFTDKFVPYSQAEKLCRISQRTPANLSSGLPVRTFFGKPRGYAFKSPCDVKLDSILIHGPFKDSQFGMIVRSNAPFEETNGITLNAEVLWQSAGVATGEEWLPVGVQIRKGDHIGILGYRGTETRILNTYSLVSEFQAELCGLPISVIKFLSAQEQFPFNEFSIQTDGEYMSRISLNATASPAPAPTASPTAAPTVQASQCIEGQDYTFDSSTSTYSSVEVNGTYANGILCYFNVPATQIFFTRLDLEWNYDFLYINPGGFTFSLEDAEFKITGDDLGSVPSSLNSRFRQFTVVILTDKSVAAQGWNFTAVSSPTPAPTNPPVPTAPPPASTVIIPAQGGRFQLGGPVGYVPSNSSVYSGNIPIQNGIMNIIQGPGVSLATLQCFGDFDIQPTGFTPWVSFGFVFFNKTESSRSEGFGLNMSGITLDFSDDYSELYNCLDLSVESLIIRDSTIINFENGLRMTGEGASLILENVSILNPNAEKQRARYFLRANGSDLSVVLNAIKIDGYTLYEGGFILGGDGLNLQAKDLQVTNIFGSDILNKPLVENPGQSTCPCTDSCFETEYYCRLSSSPSDKSFLSHAKSLFEIVLPSGSKDSKINLSDLSFNGVYGFQQATVVSVTAPASPERLATVNMNNVVITASAPGDFPFYNTIGTPTAAPTPAAISGKVPRNPTSSPTMVSEGILDSGDQVPVVAALGFFAGRFASVNLTGATFSLAQGRFFDVPNKVRRAAIKLETIATPLKIEAFFSQASDLEAVVYVGGDFENPTPNEISLTSTTVSSSQAPFASHRAVVLAENNMPSIVTLDQGFVFQADFALVHLISNRVSKSEIAPVVDIKGFTIQAVNLHFTEGASPSSSASANGLVAIWVPKATPSTCRATITGVTVQTVAQGSGLISISCRTSDVQIISFTGSAITKRTNVGNPSLLYFSNQITNSFVNADNIILTSSEPGLAFFEAQTFSLNMSTSQFDLLSSPVLHVVNSRGNAIVDNTTVSSSSIPVLKLESSLVVSLSNRQYLRITGSTFSNNTGLSQGVVNVNSPNGYVEAIFSSFLDNMAIRDLSEDYRALVGQQAQSKGGAISSESYVVVSQCVFERNTADLGGAIYAKSLFLTNTSFLKNVGRENAGDVVTGSGEILYSNFSHSYSQLRGGAIWLADLLKGQFLASKLVVRGSTFEHIESQFGAVVYCDAETSAFLYDCNVKGIEAVDGTFFAGDSASINLINSQVENVRSVDAGLLHLSINSIGEMQSVVAKEIRVLGFGGLSVSEAGSQMNIVNSSFSDVEITADGAGFYIRTSAFVKAADSTFTSFKAVSGGLAYILGGRLLVEGCSISNFNTKTASLFNALLSSEVLIRFSQVASCEAETATFARLVRDAFVTVESCMLRNLLASESSALAQLSDISTLNISSSSLESAKSTGTVTLVQQFAESKLFLYDSYVSDSVGESSMFLVSENASLSSIRTEFANNFIDSGDMPAATITLIDRASATIVQSRWIHNQLCSALAILGSSILSVDGSEFVGSRANEGGAAMVLNTFRKVRVRNSKFVNNSAPRGGAIRIWNGHLSLSESTFSNNFGALGGAIRTEQHSALDVRDTSFLNNTAEFKGGAIHAIGTALSIWGSIFTFNSAGVQGGGIGCDNATSLNISNTQFSSNKVLRQNQGTETSIKGGALFIVNTKINSSITINAGTTFERNYAEAGGAIYFDNSKSLPTFGAEVFFDGAVQTLDMGEGNIQFIKNSAVQGSNLGSAPASVIWTGENLVVEASSTLNTEILINVTDYFDQLVQDEVELRLLAEPVSQNTSGTFELGVLTTTDGRACFGLNCPPDIIAQTRTRFRAPPGSNYNFRVEARSEFSIDEGVTEVIMLNSTGSKLEVLKCKPGQVISKDGIACNDCPPGYYQPIEPETGTKCLTCPFDKFSDSPGSAFCSICEGYTGGLNGSTSCTPCDGDSVPNVRYTDCDQCVENAVKTQFFKCECLTNFYTFQQDFVNGNPVECIDCPEGGDCTVTLNTFFEDVQPQEGYWLSPWEDERTLEFVECLNEACPPQRGQCEDGYTGVLCTECEKGYRRGDEFMCEECQGGLGLVVVQIIGAWILIFLIATVITLFNIRDAEKVVREHEQGVEDELETDASTMMRILLNFLQVNTIAASFNYEWPSFVSGLLEGEAFISASLEALMNVDCALPDETAVRPYYINALIIALVPFAIPFLSLITVLIISCASRAKRQESMRVLSMMEGKDEKSHSSRRSSVSDSQNLPGNNTQAKSFRAMLERKKLEKLEAKRRERENETTNIQVLNVEVQTEKKEEKTSEGSKLSAGPVLEEKNSSVATNLSGDSRRGSVSKPMLVGSRERAGSVLLGADIKAKLRKGKRLMQYKAACLSFMFMLYPTLVSQGFNMFYCDCLTGADESCRFVPDMSQECFGTPHLAWALALGLPMILFYVIGFPLYTLFLLYRRQEDLPMNWTSMSDLSPVAAYKKRRKTMHLHILYDGYKSRFFFFEIVVLARKAVMVVISIFVQNDQAQVQAAILLIVVCIIIQQHYEPFELTECNHLEYVSLFCSFFTFYFGSFLYFSNDDIRLAAGVLVFIINISFIAYAVGRILYSIIREMTHVSKEKKAEKAKTFGHKVLDYLGNFV